MLSMFRGLAPGLVMLFGLAIGGDARADKQVDWSEYLEPAGSKPPPIKHVDLVPQQAVKTAAKAPKTTAAAKPQVKAKAKQKPAARGGHR